MRRFAINKHKGSYLDPMYINKRLKLAKITQKKDFVVQSPHFFMWCPAAESNYELVLTMDPLCRLTSGANVFLTQSRL